MVESKRPKPHRWTRKEAPCCIECEQPFDGRDMVYTDCAVTLHATCLDDYRASMRRLGLDGVRLTERPDSGGGR